MSKENPSSHDPIPPAQHLSSDCTATRGGDNTDIKKLICFRVLDKFRVKVQNIFICVQGASNNNIFW